VGQAFGSRTLAELAALTADLPTGRTGARPGPRRAGEPLGAGARPGMNTGIKAAISVIVAAAGLALAYFAGSAEFFLAVILFSMAGLVAVVQVVGARRKKRSGGSRAAR
jgi:hypothetical protein